MEKSVKNYTFKKRICALLTVLVLFLNMFSPYGVLMNKSYAGSPADDEPYFVMKIHSIDDINTVDEDDWSDDTWEYYWDYSYSKVDTPEESTNHFITMDLIIKGGTNVNTGSISFSFDSTKIIPAYSYNAGSSRNPNWQIETSIDDITDFATINWPTQMLKTYDESSSTIRVDGSSSTYLPDGYVAVTMTFLLADGVTINDLTKDMITLVPATGVSKGLEIDYFPDTINLLYVEGKDYLLFEGFAQGAKSVDSIAFKSEPSKNKYYNTETLDFTGAIITVTYDDGLAEDVTVADAISAGTITVDSMVANNTTKKVTLTYEGETVDFNYYVLDSINISSDLTKMDYEHNDTINFAGGELEATYSNASGSSVKDTINIANGISSGDIIVNRTKADVNNKTITFTYHSLSTDMLLTVTDPVASISITTVPTELTYNDGNTISFAGGQITPVTKSGNTLTPVATDDPSVTVSATTASIASIPESDRWTIAGRDGLQAGNQTITLTYEGKTADLTIVVNDTVSGVSITAQSTEKNKYGTEANALNFTGLVATVTTSGGSSFTVGANSLTIDRSSYNPTSLATQSLPVKYGTIESSNDVEITLSNYITGITTTFTKTEFDYDTPLSTVISNGTYVENYADGTSSSAKAITSDMVTGYVQKPAASLFDSTHKYNEILTIKLTSSSNSFDQLPATDTNTITINDVIDNISVLYKPTKVTYKYGETFSSTGGQINLNYKSGAVSQISMGNINVELTETDGNSINMSPAVSEFTNGVAIKTIKVTYTNNNNTYDTSFDITIKDEIDGVAISTNPKLIFNHGDTFDASTGKLTVNYKSGNTEIIDLSKAKITEIDDSEIDMSPVASSYTSNVLTKQVKVSYGGKETNYNITLQNIVDNIEIGKTAPKTNYSLNDSTIGVGGTLTVTRKAGNTETVNIEDSMVSGLDTSVAGTGKIATVTYKDEFNISASTTYTYDVNDNVTSIDITAPSKTTYKHGEKISTDGTITVHYASGTSSSVTMTESMIKEGSAAVNMSPTSYDSTNKVDKTLTIEYTEGTVTKTINYPITIVNDVRTIGMHSTNHKTKYNVNDTLDVTNAEILVTRAVGTPEVIQVTKDMVSGFNSSVENESLPLTVSYTENGITKTTNYNVSVTDTVTGIDLKGTTPSASKYGEELDLTGVTIEVTKGSGKDTVKVTSSMISGFDKNTLGEQTVTVTYGVDTSGNPVTTTFKVTVQDYVTKIEVNPASITGTYNDELADLITDNNITYTVTYAKAGSKTPISLAESMVTGYSKTETSEQNLIVTYKDNDTASYTNGQDFTETLNVTLINSVKEIAVTAPTKTEYEHGDSLDLSGGNIVVTFLDGTTQNVQLVQSMIKETVTGNAVNMSPAITEYNSNNQLTKELKVEYTQGGKTGTATYNITIVNSVDEISIATSPKTSYKLNEATTDVGGSLTIIRKAGNTETINITDGMVSGLDTTIEMASKTATVTYTEGTVTKTTTYTYSVVDAITGISIKNNPNKTTYGYSDMIDLSGGQITITKESGNTEDKSFTDTNVIVTETDGSEIDLTNVTFGTDNIATKTIKVRYDEKEVTFDILVINKITQIKIKQTPKTSYEIGDSLDLSTGTIEVTRENGNKEEIPLTNSNVIVTGFDSTKENTSLTLTVKYTENGVTKETSYNISVVDVVSDIQISTIPKTSYKYGEALDVAAGKLTVVRSSGPVTIPITPNMVTEVDGTSFDSTRLGTRNLKVTYGGMERTYEITVSDYVTGILLTPPTKVKYEYGESLDLAGGTVQKVMASGTATNKVALTDNAVIISTFDPNKIGAQTIGVTYEGITEKFAVIVEDNIKSITIKNVPTKVTYKYGEALDVTGGKIEATRSSLSKEEIPLTLSMVTGYIPNKLGKQTLTITYNGKTTTYDVTVEDYITDITITKPAKLVYKVNETIDLTGGKVNVIMASGTALSPIAMTNADVTITGFDTSSEGAKTIKVSYKGLTKTFGITVVDQLSGVILKTLPNKTDYLYGESLDLSGATLEIVKESGAKETINVTKEMISGYNSKKLGNQTVTISYEGFTQEFIVNVEDYVSSLKVIAPDKVEYEYGESLDLSGGKVSIVMASGKINETIEMTASMTSGFDKNKIGKQTITVEYKGLKGSFQINLVDKVKAISINTQANKTNYKQGEEIDVTGATITVIKSSGITVIPVTKDMISNYDKNIIGTQLVTISYSGFTTNFIVVVEKQQSQNEEQEKTDNKTNDGGSITPSTTTSTNLNQVTNNNQTTTTNTEVEKPRAEESLSDVEETNANNDKNDDETQKNPQQDTKQTETLGVNDEKEPEEKYNTKLIAGSIGILGLLFLILLICLRRNVKIYVQENGEFVLGGVTKVTKKKLYINVDPYLDGETYANQVKIRLNDTISEKLDGKELEIKHRGKKVIAKVKYEDKPYEIFLE